MQRKKLFSEEVADLTRRNISKKRDVLANFANNYYPGLLSRIANFATSSTETCNFFEIYINDKYIFTEHETLDIYDQLAKKLRLDGFEVLTDSDRGGLDIYWKV